MDDKKNYLRKMNCEGRVVIYFLLQQMNILQGY